MDRTTMICDCKMLVDLEMCSSFLFILWVHFSIIEPLINEMCIINNNNSNDFEPTTAHAHHSYSSASKRLRLRFKSLSFVAILFDDVIAVLFLALFCFDIGMTYCWHYIILHCLSFVHQPVDIFIII